nr:transcription termination factor MTERF2, chloroplastic-like [Ziziphus jujuba var. spinosa]
MNITSLIMSSSKFLTLPTDLSFTFKAFSSPDIRNLSFFSNSSNPFFTFSFQSHKFKFHFPFKTLHHRIYPSLLANPPNASPPLADDHSQSLEEAQEAFSEFLQEFGVSHKDSTFISMNSPRYLRMLVDGVRELDELKLWSSWKCQGKKLDLDLELLGFKEKISYLALDKGDNGKVALLESAVGLSLSSAMNVARYLSAETLPGLIDKVKYMKEIFFSGSNGGKLLGKNARRMMMHLSIPIDEDLQQTLSFFEKIEARRGGLNMLGSIDASFLYLVESFPRLLLLPLESHMKAMEEFLKNIGISKELMGNILQLFPPIIFCDIEVIKTRVLAFKEVAMEEKNVGKMLIKYPWILSTSIQENYKEVLSFFDMERVPKTSASHAIRSWPHLLGCSTSKLKLMVEEISKLGVRNKKLGQVICKSPQILLRKPQEFTQVVSFLKGLGFDEENVGKIICRCPEIFATSIENTLERKLKFLAAIGVSKVHLPRVIKKYPELLVSDTDRTIRPRMKYLMTFGLSERDVAFMIRRFSPLLGYNIEEVLRPKLDFLVNTMEKPITEVVEYPRYFSYSLEKKIKPRFWIIKARNVECSLKDMLGKNDEEFAAEFMAPQ